MDIYNIWCDLKPGVRDTDFAADVDGYLSHLVTAGEIAGFRLMRRKLGLGQTGSGEFHIMVEVENLAQLDAAFTTVSERADPVESLHHAVNSKVDRVQFSLYRDFPDPHRRRGEEKF